MYDVIRVRGGACRLGGAWCGVPDDAGRRGTNEGLRVGGRNDHSNSEPERESQPRDGLGCERRHSVRRHRAFPSR
jgi:hypothetical protein